MPVIQFIIGDFRGNHLLCGRKGVYLLSINSVCHHCDSNLLEGDMVYIGCGLICPFYQKDNIIGQTKDELEKYSFLPINKRISRLSFGWCAGGIYSATLVEILNALF